MKRPRAGGAGQLDMNCAKLLDRIGAELADRGTLIAGAAAAPDRADQLAAFDQGKAARRRDEGRIERSDIWMASFIGVVERLRGAPIASRRTGLALRDRNR